MTTPNPPARRVVLLAGPSGSGKGEVTRRSGLPALALDDFYREGDDPALPRRFGIADWDDPASWDAQAALTALETLCRRGRVTVPTYSISLSARTGQTRLDIGDAPLVIAEGIFAAELIRPLAAAGLLADGIVLDRPGPLVFAMRLVRDLRQSRKPVPVLLRRGWGLLGDQRADMRAWVSAGLRPLGLHRAERELRRLALIAAADGRARQLTAPASHQGQVGSIGHSRRG
ncbi:ATP-binding protein [Brachybacterium sp. Marseille-Q7125]|uniref:uridine kinase family protein n=1 Tax=Brachybacterium sp. Marseille-Q7125 TaxID=2932815 RepID=UPI001FF4D4C9|nr:ATP-binding protein [Brachybacterium sp. Marseille-Q7125]